MKTIQLDKIASVTRSCQLKREVRISAEIPCVEGVVVAVRVLTDKSAYNQLELPSGRMAQVKRGDVVAGALGHRHALFGYAGHLPERLVPGDRVQLLNMGGVLGICDAINPDLGPPFECEVLGAVLQFPYLGERIGVAARIGAAFGALPAAGPGASGSDSAGENGASGALAPFVLGDSQGPQGPPFPPVPPVPVIALVGSCMNCGKTAAACALIRELSHAGLTVDAFKATGVALRRDVLAMEDAGARTTALFSDLGVVATTPANAPALARHMLARLAAGRPDVIVAELGDGLLGAYGVAAILADPGLRASFSAVVLAANDPVAAWGGVRLLFEQFGITPTAVTGPATDNQAGTRIIEERLRVAAANARTDAPRLARLVRRKLEGKAAPAAADWMEWEEAPGSGDAKAGAGSWPSVSGPGGAGAGAGPGAEAAAQDSAPGAWAREGAAATGPVADAGDSSGPDGALPADAWQEAVAS